MHTCGCFYKRPNYQLMSKSVGQFVTAQLLFFKNMALYGYLEELLH